MFDIIDARWNHEIRNPFVFVQLMFVYCFTDRYNTINYFVFIFLSPSLRHVSAGNYGRRHVVLHCFVSGATAPSEPWPPHSRGF